MRQERTISPFTRTVQAPQTPCSHPTWVPVSSSCSRKKSAKLSRGRTSALTHSPLTSSEMGKGLVNRLPRHRGRGDRAARTRNASSAHLLNGAAWKRMLADHPGDQARRKEPPTLSTKLQLLRWSRPDA